MADPGGEGGGSDRPCGDPEVQPLRAQVPGRPAPARRGFRAELPAKLDRDAHGVVGFYPVWSPYYDTRDLRFYWEKIDGNKFRRKLRIRHYGTPDDLDGRTPVWVEIKQRVNRVTQKRRARLPYARRAALCAGQRHECLRARGRSRRRSAPRLVGEYDLRPTTVVGYVRERVRGPRGGRRPARHPRQPHPRPRPRSRPAPCRPSTASSSVPTCQWLRSR